MPIYQVGDIWYLDIRTPKGRIRRSAGTTDRKAAQELHDRLKGDTWRQAKLGDAPQVTWGQAVEKWLEVKPRGLPDRYRLRAMGVGDSTLIPLSVSTIESVLSSYTGSTFNRALALLYAIHTTSGLQAPKVGRKPAPPGRTRWLTAEEWKKLKRALVKESPLLAQAAEFTLATGLRENNVLNLEWSQVDLQRRVMWLWADQTKGKANLGVPLNDDAMVVLRGRRGIDERLVFGNPDYVLYKASNKAWYAAVRAAGLVGFRWHDLRHTWASWHVMSGTRLEELMKLGGWKSMTMVMRYAHLSTEHLAGVAANVKPISQGKMRGHRAKSRT